MPSCMFEDFVFQYVGICWLTKILRFHTLHEVAYTDYLVDGARLESAAGLDVLVTIEGNDIYFNDAKVISPNVL